MHSASPASGIPLSPGHPLYGATLATLHVFGSGGCSVLWTNGSKELVRGLPDLDLGQYFLHPPGEPPDPLRDGALAVVLVSQPGRDPQLVLERPPTDLSAGEYPLTVGVYWPPLSRPSTLNALRKPRLLSR